LRDPHSSDIPTTFAPFKAALNVRHDFIVETEIACNPTLSFVQIPLLYACADLIRDGRLVFEPTLYSEFNPRTQRDEPRIRDWTCGDKMRAISHMQCGKLFIAWGFFYDDTQVVLHGSRSVAPLLAIPLNSRYGRYDVVGYVPCVTDDELRRAGVKDADFANFRSLVLQQCIRLALLYGGMHTTSKEYPVELPSTIALARNYLGAICVDHKARLEMLAQIGLSRVVEWRRLSCRRHDLAGPNMNRVVLDTDDAGYRWGADLKQRWRDLVATCAGPSGGQRTAAIEEMQKLGWRAVLPALMEATEFDGALDAPEDTHHLGPLGIGDWLVENLPAALHLAFPDEPIQGHAKIAVYQPRGDGRLPELEKGDEVTWSPVQGAAAPAGSVWVTTVDGERSGWVPLAVLTVDRAADAAWKHCLAQVDEGIKRMNSTYVRGFKRVDFASFVAFASNKSGEAFFNRATTMETVILNLSYILYSILPADGGFDWIAQTFLLYNKLYWNWLRGAYFQSDGPVMNQQRYALKELMMRHWSCFSPTALRTAKFEGLDHIWSDICRHAGPRYTSSGPGDQAHCRTTKLPFHYSDRTHDQQALHRQMIEQGERPTFLMPLEVAGPRLREGVRGRGSQELLNHYFVERVRELKRADWEPEVCNAPVRALEKLLERCRARYGVADDLTAFSAREVTLYNSAFCLSGDEIFASESYHGTVRHEFVELGAGTVVRLMAILELAICGQRNEWLLVESTHSQHVPRLAPLGCRVITETDDWSWVQLSDVRRPLTVLPHAFDKSWHFIIRAKHEEELWE
jgi:hypothetical protein